MNRWFGFLFLIFWLFGCVHPKTAAIEPVVDSSPVRSDLLPWIDYVAALESMSSRDLKSETERWRHLSERNGLDDIRLGLVNAVQLSRMHGYQKAAETITQLSFKVQNNPDLKNWLKLYAQQLSCAAGLEKEWAEEKRQRMELEKKLKALSEIEKDMNERTKTSELLLP